MPADYTTKNLEGFYNGGTPNAGAPRPPQAERRLIFKWGEKQHPPPLPPKTMILKFHYSQEAQSQFGI